MNGKIIELTLDTCCYSKKTESLVRDLKELEKQGLIHLYYERWSKTEMDNWKGPAKPSIIHLMNVTSKCKNDACAIPAEIEGDINKKWEHLEKIRGFSSKEKKEIFTKVNKIINPAGLDGKKMLNKYGDARILAYHILRNRDIFVTLDEIAFFHNGKNRILEEEFPRLKIRMLNNELINEIKEMTKSNFRDNLNS